MHVSVAQEQNTVDLTSMKRALFFVAVVVVMVAVFFGTRGALPHRDIQEAVGKKEPRSSGVISIDQTGKQDAPYGKVAHSMGSADGKPYTNSLEAFESSYAKGFRIFETDLMPLADNEVILAHDAHESYFGLTKTFPDYKRDELTGIRYNGKYTVLFGEDLVALLRKYPDVYMILDTKANHASVLRTLRDIAGANADVMDRMIPHVTDDANIAAVREVYPFKQTLLALYRLLPSRPYSQQEIIDLVDRNRLTGVMVTINEQDPNVAKINNDGKGGYSFEVFRLALQKQGIPLYVHSADSKDQINYFRARGVGVYSDGVF